MGDKMKGDILDSTIKLEFCEVEKTVVAKNCYRLIELYQPSNDRFSLHCHKIDSMG